MTCEGGSKIVAVSDHMLSTREFSGDDLALKNQPIHRNWYALWANDVSYIPLILDRAHRALIQNSNPTQHDVAEAMYEAHNTILIREINNQLLARYGYDLHSFREQGKNQLTTTAYNSIHKTIRDLTLGVDFLVCGFDEHKDAHIFTLENNCAVKSCDAAGFWAIGSGAHSALGSMFFHATKNAFNQNAELGDALYVACEKKFMAESAHGVGGGTFVTVLQPDKWVGYSYAADFDNFKKKWLTEYAPKIPHEGKEILLKFIQWRPGNPNLSRS